MGLVGMGLYLPNMSGCPWQLSNTSAVEPSTAFSPSMLLGLKMGTPLTETAIGPGGRQVGLSAMVGDLGNLDTEKKQGIRKQAVWYMRLCVGLGVTKC